MNVNNINNYVLNVRIHYNNIENSFNLLTPNSTTIASTILPITVTKSNVFHGSLKKFC